MITQINSTTKFVLSTLLTLFALTCLTVSNAQAQNGMAIASAASYIDEDNQDGVIARGSHIAVFYTGATFPVTGGGGSVTPFATEAFDVRLKLETINDPRTFFVTLTFAGTTQINGIMPYDQSGGVLPIDACTMTLEKKVSGVWVSDRSENLNVAENNVQTFVNYIGSPPQQFANLQIWECGDVPCTYAVVVKNALDGQPNPRTHNSNPVFLVIFVTGANDDPTNLKLRFNGTQRFNIASVSAPGYQYIQQLNWQIPADLAAGTYVLRVWGDAEAGTNESRITFQ